MLALLTRAVRAFFVDDIRLRRDGRVIRVTLENGDGPYVSPEERIRQALEQRRSQELQQMRAELAELLDADPGSRERLRHLAYVEQQLGVQGLALLEKVSVALLREASRQLEESVLNWSQVGLATLRSKLAVAVKERGIGTSHDTAEADAALPTTAVPALEVSEAPLGEGEAALLEAYRAMRGGPVGVESTGVEQRSQQPA